MTPFAPDFRSRYRGRLNRDADKPSDTPAFCSVYFILNENDIVMHDYKKLHERELNKNGNRGKLVMHGYTILPGGDLNENENLNIEIIYFIFWDRRINVILFHDVQTGREINLPALRFMLVSF